MQFNFISNDESEEINDAIKCLKNIMQIPEGSIPLNRGLGLKWAALSSVPEDLENDYATDLIEKVETWEPRLEVTEVSFDYGEDGDVTVNVQIELSDEYNDSQDEEDEE